MELKSYQKTVMSNLSLYMDCLNEYGDIFTGWKEYWDIQDIKIGQGGVPAYKNTIKNVPHVCMKVPTGGGKTLMACAAIKKMFDGMPQDKSKVVIWLVPSDSILKQTTKALSDPNHPYRQKLNADFGGRVGVYTKDMLLNGQNFSPDTVREMLTVCILTFGSLRINSSNKDVRKAYQENGSLMRFAAYFNYAKDLLLDDTPDTALMQVIRQLSPVVVVDESHNATSDLSVEMLENLNPTFILDLTATPKKDSNIISYVDARELKKENMVKLPIIVYNRDSLQSVISDAILLRGQIEKQATDAQNNGGPYIRPIVLFQAQPKLKGKDTETYENIKHRLIEMGIKEDNIGIKTSEVDTISNLDLLSPVCKIRYIITVNALKEGWDCPFAYILASLANKSSTVDVEQILGRILRQPYAAKHKATLLNSSYVLTCSKEFSKTIDSVVAGLNRAGFSRKDYRMGQFEEDKPNDVTPKDLVLDLPQDTGTEDVEGLEEDDFSDVNTEEVKDTISASEYTPTPSVSEMISQAEKQSEQYETEINNVMNNGFTGGELGDMLNKIHIQEQYKTSAKNTILPQFFIESGVGLFGDEYSLLEPENLSENFSLIEQNAEINFELSTGDVAKVDIQDTGEAIPKYKTGEPEVGRFLEYLKQKPKEEHKNLCISHICEILGRNDRIPQKEIMEYVNRAISNLSEDQLNALETTYQAYANRIEDKIRALENTYRQEQFKKWIDTGKILCKNSYTFPDEITPSEVIDSIPLSLYEGEKDDINRLERRVVEAIVRLNNIEFWHRNISRRGFRINGFINHYPDFIVKTKKGNLVIVESKGDDRDGEASLTRLRLGRTWANMCPDQNCKYFMVYDKEKPNADGAYLLEDFIELLKDL